MKSLFLFISTVLIVPLSPAETQTLPSTFPSLRAPGGAFIRTVEIDTGDGQRKGSYTITGTTDTGHISIDSMCIGREVAVAPSNLGVSRFAIDDISGPNSNVFTFESYSPGRAVLVSVINHASPHKLDIEDGKPLAQDPAWTSYIRQIGVEGSNVILRIEFGRSFRGTVLGYGDSLNLILSQMGITYRQAPPFSQLVLVARSSITFRVKIGTLPAKDTTISHNIFEGNVIEDFSPHYAYFFTSTGQAFPTVVMDMRKSGNSYVCWAGDSMTSAGGLLPFVYFNLRRHFDGNNQEFGAGEWLDSNLVLYCHYGTPSGGYYYHLFPIENGTIKNGRFEDHFTTTAGKDSIMRSGLSQVEDSGLVFTVSPNGDSLVIASAERSAFGDLAWYNRHYGTDTASAITEPGEKLLSLWTSPNPASGTSDVTVHITTPTMFPIQICLFNALGQLVGQNVIPPGQTHTHLSISRLSASTYFLTAVNGRLHTLLRTW